MKRTNTRAPRLALVWLFGGLLNPGGYLAGLVLLAFVTPRAPVTVFDIGVFYTLPCLVATGLMLVLRKRGHSRRGAALYGLALTCLLTWLVICLYAFGFGFAKDGVPGIDPAILWLVAVPTAVFGLVIGLPAAVFGAVMLRWTRL